MKLANVLYGTHWISEDEPCLGLFEMHEQSPDSRGFHRYQIIYVMRGDKPAEYRKDMGSYKKWRGCPQLRILGGANIDGKFYIEETVGRLRDIADYERNVKHDYKDIVGVDALRIK